MVYSVIDEERLRILYKRAQYQTKGGRVYASDHPELAKVLCEYSQQNDCSFDEAYDTAKHGKKG
ncbi:MAG: hypothetical protein J6P61_03780 [Erysipelotrichaceae bacterium]|nr:hypothetical protein [Erysipelotrichaceae bacterium]